MEVTELDKQSTVCALSADMQFLIRELKKSIKKSTIPISAQEEMIGNLQTVSGKVRTVQKKAQKMEKRMGTYLNGIERMGFKRSR